MKLIKKSPELVVVILYCPYMNMENRQTRELFSKLIRLKNRGYGNRHASNALPLDVSDFVADHPLLCTRESDGSLTPISCSKVITYEMCRYYNLEFAMESCFKAGKLNRHMDLLSTILTDTNSYGRKIAYHGGYTIDPLARTDQESINQIRDLFMGSTYLYLKSQLITDLLGLGVPKFKTEKFFYDWGYSRCKTNGLELAEFPLSFLPGVNGVMMHLEKYSDNVISMADKHYAYWNERIEVGQPFMVPSKNEKIAA